MRKQSARFAAVLNSPPLTWIEHDDALRNGRAPGSMRCTSPPSARKSSEPDAGMEEKSPCLPIICNPCAPYAPVAVIAARTIRRLRYEVIAPLAEGGMGAVFRARRRLLGDEVALKIVRADAGGDGAARERFLRESRACAQLRHPNIVSILDYNLDAEGGRSWSWSC